MKDMIWSGLFLAGFGWWWWHAQSHTNSPRADAHRLRRDARPSAGAWLTGAEAHRPVITVLRGAADAAGEAQLAALAACLSNRDVLLVYVLEVPLQFELNGYAVADQAIIERLDAVAQGVRAAGRAPLRRILRTRDWAGAVAQLIRETQPAAAVLALPEAFVAQDYEILHAAGRIIWVSLPPVAERALQTWP